MKGPARDKFDIPRRALTAAALAALVTAATIGSAAAQGEPVDSGLTAAGQAAGQPETPATNASPAQPAMHSFGMHQDTPGAREELLSRRPVADRSKIPTDVPPLPAQTISPPAPAGR